MSQQYSDDDYTAVQRHPDDPFNDSVPPFPQDHPAFGSPEAVEQAAETITRGPSRQQLDDWRAGAHPDSRMQQLYLAAVRFQEQRDALADALQRLRSFLGVFLCHDGDGQWRIALDVEPGAGISGEAITQAEAALRKAGR